MCTNCCLCWEGNYKLQSHAGGACRCLHTACPIQIHKWGVEHFAAPPQKSLLPRSDHATSAWESAQQVALRVPAGNPIQIQRQVAQGSDCISAAVATPGPATALSALRVAAAPAAHQAPLQRSACLAAMEHLQGTQQTYTRVYKATTV